MIQDTGLRLIFTEALRRSALALQHVITSTHTAAQVKSLPLPSIQHTWSVCRLCCCFTQRDCAEPGWLKAFALVSSLVDLSGYRKIMEQCCGSHAAMNVPMSQSADIFVAYKVHEFFQSIQTCERCPMITCQIVSSSAGVRLPRESRYRRWRAMSVWTACQHQRNNS